jgi:alkylhydroperoxidase/carboxymuconolactone decarboxylase family protein YurZ/uncharacterized metal-binding protein
MAVETLSSKQKHLIGVSAAMAAGCQPCTSSFVGAAREAGACERGTRLALEQGLQTRDSARTAMASFADATFAKPELDEAFRAERKQLEALMAVAAAVASNMAALVDERVRAAKALGASDAQIRLARSIAITAREGAEKEVESAFTRAVGDPGVASCCSGAAQATDPVAGCGATLGKGDATPCGCSQAAEPGFETLKIEKTKAGCSLCDEYAKKQSEKPFVVMSCEGACLRGEISRQAANRLCFELMPEKAVRLCLGGAFTKDTGQRALVRNARHVLALEGCGIRCASRMMRAHFPELAATEFVTDGLCQFDRSLFGLDALPPGEIQALGRTAAAKIMEKL